MEEQEKIEEVKDVEVKEEEQKDDRPVENYKAELDRKNKELERLRLEMASRSQAPQRRDPNDISTWSDQELRLLKKDPQFSQYHDQADDLLLERKTAAIMQKNMDAQKRVNSEMTLRKDFPEALDPSSDFASKMDQVMSEYDLAKTPAGRLAAAKLVAAELEKGQSTAEAKARKTEQARVARVKSEMVDGDRAKPTNEVQDLDAKKKELADKLMDTKNENKQVDAVSQYLHSKGMSAKDFFKR